MRHRIPNLNGLANLIPLQTATAVPLRRQLYQGLRTAIISHQLQGGTRLPSSRALAGQLQFSRTTVVEVYQQLLLEGYLEGRRGSGTFVSHTLPEALLGPAAKPPTLDERVTVRPTASPAPFAVVLPSAFKAPG